MTPAELERLRKSEGEDPEVLRATLTILGVLALCCSIGGAVLGLLAVCVDKLLGRRLSWAPVIGFPSAVLVGVIVAVLLVLVHRFVVRPFRLSRLRRSKDYAVVDEVVLENPEAFICFDPIGYEEDTSHGKLRMFHQLYLLDIGSDRVLPFADHNRGDIYHLISERKRDDPYGWFPSRCRLVYLAGSGSLFSFEVLGPIVEAIGSFHWESRPQVLRTLKRGRPGPVVLGGHFGAPSRLVLVDGGFVDLPLPPLGIGTGPSAPVQ